MATHYSSNGKSAYAIKAQHPECPITWDKSAKSMTTARIDYERVQDAIINWYELNILNKAPESSNTTKK